MTTPTVPVTVTLAAQDGTPYVGITVRARLDVNEVYQGFVISDQIEALTDADGIAVLNCFPNAPDPTGLGTQGSTYSFRAAIPGGRSLNVEALVPNTACRLENILVSAEPVAVDGATLALLQAQAALSTVTASQEAAADSADDAAASATAAAASKTAAQTAQASADTAAATATSKATEATTRAAQAAAASVAAEDSRVAAEAAATFTQAGTGAVPRTLADKNLDIVSVLDYASTAQKADVRAHTAAVDVSSAAMLAKAALPASGGALFFSFGKYLLNATVAIAASGVSLYSDGATIVNGQTNAPAIYMGDGVTRYYANSVNGLNFTSKAATGTFGQAGIVFKRQGHLKVTNIVADDSTAPLYRGILFDDVAQYNVSGMEVQNCLEAGVLHLNCVDGRIVNARSDGNAGQGFWMDGSEGHTFTNCSAYNNDSSAWRLVSTDPATRSNKNNWFIGCTGDTSGAFNWNITDSKDSFFVACWGATQQSDAVNTWANGFYIGSQHVKEVQFLGGGAYNNNSHGVLIDSTGGGPEGIQFVGFAFGSLGAAFNGNGKSGSGHGLSINGTADLIRVLGGSFRDNASGPYSNSSSGTDIKITGLPIGLKSENRGVATVSDGGTIAHGLAGTPSWFATHATYTTELATVTGADATNLTVALKTPVGGGGTTQQVYWEAYL